MSNRLGGFAGRIKLVNDLAEACKGLDTEQTLLALSTQKVSLAQARDILIKKGVAKETAENAVANSALAASQTAATGTTISLSSAFKGLAASLGISATALGVITGIVAALGVAAIAIGAYNKEKKEARKAALESIDVYKDEQSLLDDQIKKYKELTKVLESGNLSVEETVEKKEELLGIQNNLIDTFGDEAEGIDLVNGKYQEQLDLLQDISKQSAANIVSENKDEFEDAKKELEKNRTYQIGRIANWSTLSPLSDKENELVDFIKYYSDLFTVTSGSQSGGAGEGHTYSWYELKVKANVEDADKVLHDFSEDLRKFGDENNIDVSGILDSIGRQLDKTWTEELTEYKTIYDEYATALVMSNDKTREKYKEAIDAVNAYNNAIATGEGYEEAKSNLASVKLAVEELTNSLANSEEYWGVFQQIFSKQERSREQRVFDLKEKFGLHHNDKTLETFFANENVDIEWFERIASVSKTAADAIKMYRTEVAMAAEETPAFAITPEEAEALSDYQSKIDSIGDSLTGLKDLTSSDITSLMLDFKDNAEAMAIFEKFGVTGEEGVGDLEGALNALAELMRDMAIKECPQLADAINSIFDQTITHPFGDTKELRKEYEDLMKLFEDISDGQTLSLEAATELINQYPDLADAVKVVGEEYAFEEDAIRSLINAKIEVLNKATSHDYKATKAALENTKARIAALKAEYAMYADSVKYFVSDTDEKSNFQKKLIDDKYAYQLNALSEQEAELEELLGKLEVVNDNSSSEFSDEIDWAAHSVSVLEEKVSDLERVFDNVKGYEAQKEALQAVNEELVNLKTGYEKAAKAYRDDYEKALNEISDEDLRKKIRHAIESGKRFDIEAYVGADDEELHKDINEAIDAYNNLTDAENNAIEVGIKLDENALKQLELDADRVASIRDVVEAALNREVRDKQKIALYKAMSDQIKADYDAQIAIAEAEGQRIVAQKLEIEKQQELNDLEKEMLDYVREIDEYEANSLEHQYEKLQNQIDLNDGEGNLEQYAEQYELAKKIHKEKEDTYLEEVKLLEEIKNQYGENSSEYRTQLYRVHDISLELDEWVKTLKEVSVEILSLPFDELEKALEGFDDQIEDVDEGLEDISDQLSGMDTVISGAQAYIQDQIDAQEELKKPIEEQLEAMQKANDERERTLALDKARYELERAQSQRTVKLYSGEEKGFIYTQDYEAVRDAQENLSNLEYEDAVHQLEQQLEYYDEIIEDLQEIKDAWGEVAQNAQDTLDIQKAMAALGADGIMSLDMVAQYEKSYTSLLSSQESLENQKKDLEEKKKSLEELIEEIEKIIEAYQNGELTLEQATIDMQSTLFENAKILEEAFPDEIISVKIQSMIDNWKDIFEMNDVLADAFGRMKGEIDKFAANGYENLEEATDNIVKIFEDFYNEMAQQKGLEELDFTGLISDTSAIEDLLNMLKGYGWESIHLWEEDYQKFWDELLGENNNFASYAQTAEEAEEKVVDSTEDMTENVVANISETVISIADSLDKIASVLTGADETISTDVDETTTGIKDAVTDTNDTIVDSTEKAMDDTSTAISDGTEDQLVIVRDYASAVNEIIQSMCTSMSKIVTSTFEDLNKSIEDATKSIAIRMNEIVVQAAENMSKIQQATQEVLTGTDDKVVTIKTTGNTNFGGVKSDVAFQKIESYHTGLERGLVGEENTGEGIQALGLRKLAPDEIPAVLKFKEAVLTELQQQNVLDNFGEAYKAGMSNVMPAVRNAQVSVGDINITCPGVTSQQVMNQIGTELHKHFGNFALDALQISNKR